MSTGDERGSATPQRSLEQLLLAGLGWLTLGAEAVEELADELARKVGVERDEMRRAVRDTIGSWKAEADRLDLRRDQTVERLVARLGVVRREEIEDISLRLAQLEHRLRLLERPPGS